MALHIGQMRSAGRLGEVGFAVNLIGLGLFGGAALRAERGRCSRSAGSSRRPVTRLALLVSAAVFVVGVILFGVGDAAGPGLSAVAGLALPARLSAVRASRPGCPTRR